MNSADDCSAVVLSIWLTKRWQPGGNLNSLENEKKARDMRCCCCCRSAKKQYCCHYYAGPTVTVSSDLGHIYDPFEKSHQTMSQQILEEITKDMVICIPLLIMISLELVGYFEYSQKRTDVFCSILLLLFCTEIFK